MKFLSKCFRTCFTLRIITIFVKFVKSYKQLQKKNLPAIINIHQFLNIHIENSYSVFKTKFIKLLLQRFQYIFW